MPSASATFTVGSPSAAQQQVSPSINPMVNTNSSLNYPTYVPVSVPAPVPSKEAAITNVSIPQQVLPGSSFSIIVSITTYVAGTVNYTVTLQIPQLSLNQTSIPMTLSNMAVGTTTFNVSLPVTARALTASGVVTGQLNLQDTTNNQTVDGVPISFNIGGTSIPTSIGVVPSPIQPVPLGPVGRPVIGSTYTGPGAVPVRSYQGRVMRDRDSYQGYVFGQGSGQQRHQWDYMPHQVGGRYRAFQGTLGVDYTLACSDQSTANAAGQCANGTRAVVSPISQAPPPVVAAPTPTVVPTSTDTGIPVVQAPAPTVAPTPAVVPDPTPVVVTPTLTPITTPIVTTPTPIPTTTVTPAVVSNIPTHDWQQHTRREYPHWRQDQGHGYGWDPRRRTWDPRGGVGGVGGVGRPGSVGRAYQAVAQQPQATPQSLQPQPQVGSQLQPVTQGGAGGAVILTSMLPDGTLHLDAHGFQPMEPITLDLNIPMSRVTKTTSRDGRCKRSSSTRLPSIKTTR